MFGSANNMRQFFENLIAPELNKIQGQLVALNARIYGLDTKIDGMQQVMQTEIRRVDARIDSLDKSLNSKIDGMQQAMRSTEDALRSEIRHVADKVEEVKASLALDERVKRLEDLGAHEPRGQAQAR
ncbi:MAG: hypothetical protein M0Z27_06285 [Thermaerobacter sp.]|nr:hypothetical protein [Thermaerobacter sp.]